ncbi:MAG: PD-(D/E)XK nuclease family protein, partial [Thermodesulfobacteriota bacterium]
YVALTRAKHLCYTAWGHLNISRTSAPFYLWHTEKNMPGEEQRECKQGLQFFSEAKVQSALQCLATDCSHIAVREMPVQKTSPWHGELAPDLPGENLNINRSLQTNRRLSSFTYLIRGSGEDEKGQDEIASQPEESAFTAMSGFPRGIKPGNLLHSLMENAEFEQTDPAAHAPLVRSLLHSYRFHPEWEETLCTMLSQLLQARLHTEQGMTLSEIPANQRIHELEFYIPLSRVSPKALQEFYLQQAGQEINLLFADKLGRLAFSPHQGFLQGFMDLVFCHKGKYYLLDWKSNYLGPNPEDYGPDTLQSTMLRDFYLLQSHLYSLALHLHLKQRMQDYDPARHFGGLFYIFLRGVDKDIPGQGIFFQQPGQDFLQQMEEFLLPG